MLGKSLVSLPFVALAVLCWGLYGPALHEGQAELGDFVDGKLEPSRLRAFICVGVAYFLVAVLPSQLWLSSRGEKGRWTWSGSFWSLAAGLAGAVGALGVILAFANRGSPIYVMPLVFGLAPVVNTLTTMTMARTFKKAPPAFLIAIGVVAVGAGGVWIFSPAQKGSLNFSELTISQVTFIAMSIALTALSWGMYGPVLHQGQAKMHGSRLRPFLCVGLAYFVVAVLAPVAMMPAYDEPGSWQVGGTLWSLAAGGVGAIGALGVILAFNFGGRPIFVMPLVFGGAPVVNTAVSMAVAKSMGPISGAFLVSLVLVIAGAAAVLIFAPRAKNRGR